MNEDITRRNYLKLNWKASVGFLSHMLSPHLEQERDCFRPPGAGNEFDFITSCTRCGKCSEVCPEGIIRLLPATYGAGKVNTPYLDPNLSPCTFCQKCIDTCPTDALSFFHYSKETAIGKASIRKDACLAYQNVMCDYCYRACPIDGAMMMENGIPVVNDEVCNGCGICVSRCINEYKGIWVHLIS